MGFIYGTSTPGLYRANAEATSGELRASDTMTTDVSGLAVLDIQVDPDRRRVIDVGKTNYYDITIKNVGTKEATRLQLSGKLTTNLKVLRHFNVEKGEFQIQPQTGAVHLPRDRPAGRRPVDHAEPGGPGHRERTRPAATSSSPTPRWDAEDAKVEDVISTTVTGNGRPRTASTKQP